MDNPQHYQPLSHALNPPVNPQQPTFTTAVFQTKTPTTALVMGEQDEEEDEEGEEDEEDVEEQSSRSEPDAQPNVSSAHNQDRCDFL